MDIQKQQLIANILLTKLEAIDPFCILAGGAPYRDWETFTRKIEIGRAHV